MTEIAVPVPAATVLLLRDGEEGLEVLMTKRHDAAGFAAGALVFPGGKVDPADKDCLGACRDGAALANPPAPFWIAGIRETFEECGVLLGRRRGGDALLASRELGEMVARHGRGPAGFAALLAAGAVELATELLVPFAHWITPVDRPKRFDTHFFVAPAPPDQAPEPDGREATELVWVSPSRALEAADEGRMNLVFATRMNLFKLARSGSVAEALSASRAAPIVTVTPELVRRPDGPAFRIPAEAGYGVSEIPAANIPRA